MPNCKECNDTGVFKTGNNDLPCDCPAEATVLFNVAGVEGPVTGEEFRRHLINNCPEPIGWLWPSTRPTSNLPGRKIMIPIPNHKP